ncbi:MAG: undecaprenyldiphospho-muramoylpentapeptide beta-N-acetylglucosaminyltransferase [Patescibacteria group bacterium]
MNGKSYYMIIQNKKTVKILLIGGGTGGSVSPLLAIAEELRIRNYELENFDFLWIGTKNGPEREMVEKENIPFKTIVSGKLRRYFSLQNFIDIFKIKIAFWQSLFILLKWRPDLVISAGSFVSVPAVWAAWFLGAKVLIHQQDVRPGLANRLIAPIANVISVTFENSLADYGKKAIWVGNPVRKQLSIINYQLKIKELKKKFNLQENLPIALIIGGGTGATAINKLVEQSLNELIKFCQIIHITGKNKSITNYKSQIMNYTQYEFLDIGRMAEVYNLADVVVSRCGLGVLSDLSYLGKPVILIPLPDSHQEDNVAVFAKAKAAIILKQKELTKEKLTDEIKKLIENKELQKTLSQNIKQVIKQGANKAIAEIIRAML